MSHTVNPNSNNPWHITDENQEIYLQSPPSKKNITQNLIKEKNNAPVHIK